jgi:hypothetical protein
MRPDRLRQLSACHEAGHALVAVRLGVPVLWLSLWANGRTWHGSVASATTGAAIAWGGVVAESLLPHGPQSPATWQLQPDNAYLRSLRPTTSAAGFELAMRLILADPDAQTAVLALADRLARRRLLFGWQVRRILADPWRYPPRPPKRRGKQPPPGYIRRSMASPDWGDE